MNTRVLIVGGGMAGSALALAMRRLGVEPEVVERAASWPAHGAGIYLVGNALRALRELGLEDEVVEAGAPIRTQTLLDRRGRLLAEIDTREIWGACGPCVGLSRTHLQQILSRGLSTADVRFSTTVVGLETDGPETVVTFSDGDVRAYDLVVGADGLHSSIRPQLFPDSKPRFCGQVGWRFVAPCPPTIVGWTLFAGTRGVFLLIPIGNGQVYGYADAEVSTPFADSPEGRVERLQMRFSHYGSPVPEVLAQLSSDQVHFAAVEDILQTPWSRGGVLLVGDAAHATSPNMASGAAMAFEDAVVLARLVRAETDMSAVIAEYTRRRSGRVRWVHTQTHQRDRIRRLPSFLRDRLTQRLAGKVYAANYTPLLQEL